MPTRTTRRQLGGIPPVASTLTTPFHTHPLPTDRTSWPMLDGKETGRIWHCALMHHCDPTGRLIIGACGGSSEVIAPLFRASAQAHTEPVALDVVLGDTLHPLRLAYLIAGMRPTDAARGAVVPLLDPAIRQLLLTGGVRDRLIAVLLFDTVFRVYGAHRDARDAVMAFTELRKREVGLPSSMLTTWDDTSGVAWTEFRL